jgi:nicotinate-nucleotide adenylyltransferase
MLRLAIEDNTRFAVLDVELTRGGVSFTVDTLRQLRENNPSDKLHLIIGMDNLVDFHTWKSPQTILSLATVVVMTRPGFDGRNVPAEMKSHVRICDVPEIEIASREIRKRVSTGKSIQYLVAKSVEGYIEEHRLYRER